MVPSPAKSSQSGHRWDANNHQTVAADWLGELRFGLCCEQRCVADK
jgi:hypothetical protein